MADIRIRIMIYIHRSDAAASGRSFALPVASQVAWFPRNGGERFAPTRKQVVYLQNELTEYMYNFIYTGCIHIRTDY